MTKIYAWLNAARLRTLPLSVSGILVGTALATFLKGESDYAIFVLALLTAIGFQITSNLANDYGDGVKGIDNDDRIGPKRALQSGSLTRKELKNGVIISIIIDLILVSALLYFSFGIQNLQYYLLFFVLGGLSVWAAISYTVGDSAYGYRGLGDLFVFIFFGILAVLGTFFLYTKVISLSIVLPAISIGLLSTGVLNLNNLRDYQSDKKSKKNTLVVKMGYERGKQYHVFLISTSFASILVFSILKFETWLQFIPLLAFITIFVHMMKVLGYKGPEKLDPELKKLALSTFLLATLFYACYNNFL